MPELSFPIRLVALLVVLVLLAGWDRWRHGKEAARWREYTFLVSCAVLGGVFAVCNDLLTGTLSPDYFVVAKGIETGPGFRWRVGQLAFHAGFLAGAVVAGCLLLANQPRPTSPCLTYRSLFLAALRPLVAAIALAPVGGLLSWACEPIDLTQRAPFLGDRERRFVQLVWGIHAGLYAGALLGLGWGWWCVRRARLSLPGATDPAPAPAAPAG